MLLANIDIYQQQKELSKQGTFVTSGKRSILSTGGYILFLILFSIFTGCGPNNTTDSKTFDITLAKQMESALNTSINEHNITGAVLAVRSPDSASWKTAVGYSIEETDTNMTTNLYFRIGSITKTFTSTLTLMLVDGGLISLDTTVNEVVPELNVLMGDFITIRDLLDMRSGLQTYVANEDFGTYIAFDPGRIWLPEELVYYTNIVLSEPNVTFLYNNGNYIILGLIIEKLTSESYTKALEHYILNPLGLRNTLMPDNGNMPEPFANGYQYNVEANLTANFTYYLNPSIAWSAGGLISNVDDLLIWSNAYIKGSLLSEVSHQEQFTLLPVTSEENPVIQKYGLGVMQDGILIGHDGFIPPYGSWVATYKNYDFVLLLNGTRQSSVESVFAATTVLEDVINAVDSQL